LIPAGTGFNAYEDQGVPEVDLTYDVLDDDLMDLSEIVDDRTARAYGLDSFEDRPTFSFESFGATPPVEELTPGFSPVVDDDELIDDTSALNLDDDL
jgi:DNA-directed RNA polymerase subunit beta'